jgi:hypothetical protein
MRLILARPGASLRLPPAAGLAIVSPTRMNGNPPIRGELPYNGFHTLPDFAAPYIII